MAVEKTVSTITTEEDAYAKSTNSRRKSTWQSKLGNSLFIIILVDMLWSFQGI